MDQGATEVGAAGEVRPPHQGLFRRTGDLVSMYEGVVGKGIALT